MHEASLYDDNCFITLTYADENLPEDGSLRIDDFQRFLKRLRKQVAPKKIRYFHCGEYGDKFGRPHFHSILFGFDFADKYLWKTRGEHDVFRSPLLEKVWPDGNSEIGSVTFESAAYVASYISKKRTGDQAEEYYEGRKPEYATMSRRPGIAANWFARFKDDVAPKDEVIVRGRAIPLPRWYLSKLSDEERERIALQRHKAAVHSASENRHERMLIREEVLALKLEQKKRSYDDEA